jgi:hypothetical protein
VTARTKSVIHAESDFRRRDSELIARAPAPQMVTPPLSG